MPSFQPETETIIKMSSNGEESEKTPKPKYMSKIMTRIHMKNSISIVPNGSQNKMMISQTIGNYGDDEDANALNALNSGGLDLVNIIAPVSGDKNKRSQYRSSTPNCENVAEYNRYASVKLAT